MDTDYVIIDYTNCKEYDNSDRKIMIVSEKTMFEYLNTSKQNGLKISVYKLGKCLLDWS